jgi:hypothetical protein
MGYACPVCDEPQQDAEHLANHLAFQAMTHGGDHESWLDEHAPDWAANGPAELAPRVADLAAAADYEVVFEDTADDGRDEAELYDPDLQGTPGHGHDDARGHGSGRVDGHSHGSGTGDGYARSRADIETDDLSPEARDVIDTARDLTRRMYTGESDDDREGDDVEEAEDTVETEDTDGEPRD